MARGGTGTYTKPTASRTSGTVISSTDYNTDIDDIATALTDSIAKDGQTTPTANLPMGGYRHTGVGNASARTHYAVVGQIQDGSYIWCGTAGGTANALTLTPSPAITAYAAGQSFEFKAGSSASSSTVTVAISGLSTIAIQQDGAALVSGEIEANKFYRITLDTTSTAQLLKIGSPSVAAASETVAGKIEIATAAETTAGTDDTRAITPLKLATFAPASATFDTANDKLIALDATDGKLKQMAFPSSGITLGTEQATTSGTAIDFTSIPAGTKRISIMFKDVSTNGTSPLIIQIGDSGGIEATGYAGGGGNTGAGYVASTTGFSTGGGTAAADTINGTIILSLENAAAFTWASTGTMTFSSVSTIGVSGGSKSLSAELDRVRITTVSGSPTFDAGAINISFE